MLIVDRQYLIHMPSQYDKLRPLMAETGLPVWGTQLISTGFASWRRYYHRSRIRYLSKKNSRILTNFPKLKKIVKIRKKIR